MFESLTLEQKKAIAVVCAAVLLLDDKKERPNKPRVGQEVLPRDPKTFDRPASPEEPRQKPP